MADVEVRLTLQGGESGGGVHCYESGSTVRGMVRLVSTGEVRCDRVFVSIGWHTEGRSDRDCAQVGEVELHRGRLDANTYLTPSFSFRLPDHPWSYAGHYINIIWEVTVTVAVPFGRDIKRTEP